jgi:TusA-related sulfurtransferase
MKNIVDARGLSCPEPVLLLKRVIDDSREVELMVDSNVSVEICTRFAVSRDFRVSVTGGHGQYVMTLVRDS